MSWSFFGSLISLIFMIINVSACLIVGLYSVGINLSKHVLKIVMISIFAGLLYFFSQQISGSNLVLIGIFLLLIPITSYILKQQKLKIVVAILIAFSYDVMIIKLIEDNFFDLILSRSQFIMDAGITFSINLFVALNNLIVIMILYSKSPQLFPDVLFEKQIIDEGQTISFRPHLYFTIFLLLLLNAGLYLLYMELAYLRLAFRIALSLWNISICISLISFLRISITYKNERIQVYLDKQYQKDVLSFYNIIRSQRHDFNFHLTSIYGLIQNQNYDSCKVYIEEMVKDAHEINEILPLHHPALGAMLSTFKGLAENKGITIHYYITDDLRKMPCSIYEMNKILGNLIQNALDEVENRNGNAVTIEVEVKRESDNIVIIVSNVTDITEDELRKIFHIGYSSKDFHEGLGLPTVLKIVTKYNGVIYPQIMDEWIHFTVRIPFAS